MTNMEKEMKLAMLQEVNRITDLATHQSLDRRDVYTSLIAIANLASQQTVKSVAINKITYTHS